MCIICEIERGRRLENTIANDALMVAIKDLAASVIARSQAGTEGWDGISREPQPEPTRQSRKLPELNTGVAYQRLLDRITESNRQLKVLHSAIADAREMGYINESEYQALQADLS